MKAHVLCEGCGEKNEVGGLFCRKCGARLDLSGVKPPMAVMRGARREPRKRRGPLRFVFPLILVAVAALILLPVEPLGRSGLLDDADILRGLLIHLELAAKRGQHMTHDITEEQANAYLADSLARTGPAAEGKAFMLRIRSINLALTRGRFVLLVAAAWGPLRLTYEMSGVPARGERGFGVEIQGARLGQLPLPSPLREKVAARMAGIFARMTREKYILDRAAGVEIGDGSVRISL